MREPKPTGVPRVEREGGEKQERESRKVVRLFLFQSITPEDLHRYRRPENIQFTRMILARKGGENTKDQLVPVGGDVREKERESVKEAALREAIEETHLRPTEDSFVTLPIQHHYSFIHHSSGDKRKERLATYCFGRLLPTDEPFPLDPEEDKIDQFDALTLREYRILRKHGMLKRDGKTLSLFDNLQTDPEKRSLAGVETDQFTVDYIHEELDFYFRRIEAHKKVRVLRHLITSNHRPDTQAATMLSPNEHDGILTRLDHLYIQLSPRNNASKVDLSEHISEAEDAWKNIVVAMGADMNDVAQALQFSNLTGSLSALEKGRNIESGRRLPSLTLAFPFLVGERDLQLTELRILHSNPVMWKLLKMTQLFRHWDTATHDQTEKGDEARGKIRQILFGSAEGDGTPVNFDMIIRHLRKEGLVDIENNAETRKYSIAIDQFFTELEQFVRTEAPTLGSQSLIDQSNEVMKKDALTLLGIVFGRNPNVEAMGEEQKARVKWDAQRKLLLMPYAAEVHIAREKIIEIGVDDIETVEHGLEARGKSAPDARVIVLNGREYRVKIDGPPKTEASMLRKELTRDQSRGTRPYEQLFDDVFRSSYVFQDKDPGMLEEITVSGNGSIFNAAGTPVETLTTIRPVAELLESYLQKVDEYTRSGIVKGRFTIEEFKDLPKEGKGFQSKSAGGGGKIRMAKWYFVHVDENGTRHAKEIQVYVPRKIADDTGKEKIVSGEFDYLNKQADDRVYQLARLFITNGLRSTIEQLRPAAIHGQQSRRVYTELVSRRRIEEREHRKRQQAAMRNGDATPQPLHSEE